MCLCSPNFFSTSAHLNNICCCFRRPCSSFANFTLCIINSVWTSLVDFCSMISPALKVSFGMLYFQNHRPDCIICIRLFQEDEKRPGPRHVSGKLWQYRGQKRPSFAVEPGNGKESVWDYPRPPRLLPDGRRVEVRLGDLLIAGSTQTYRVL